jgi:hypothetical protein
MGSFDSSSIIRHATGFESTLICPTSRNNAIFFADAWPSESGIDTSSLRANKLASYSILYNSL